MQIKGCCVLSVIPLRAEPSDKAEMTNQVLYGETFDIIIKEEKWSKIKLHHDQYEGWIDNKQWMITKKSKHNLRKGNIVQTPLLKYQSKLFPAGSNVDFDIVEHKKSLLQTAKQFLNTPYLWGGRTMMGIDCSGFTQIVFRLHKIFIPRDAYQQANIGKKVAWKDVMNNDLAFFANTEGKIIHVGIIIKDKTKTSIIHASGMVRIDTLNEQGIRNEELDIYTHTLHSIKRIKND